MFVDSHCHLNMPELADDLPLYLEAMETHQVTHALCVGVNAREWPSILAISEQFPHIFASVGVHPDYDEEQEPTVESLIEAARHPSVVAIGETGLDYYRLTGDLAWQRERFRVHIRAAKQAGLPLIIHTRNAPEDTLAIMKEEGAAEVGGVMHCFTESEVMARAAIEMGFMISFSGIVTFKNAKSLQALAQSLPIGSLLIETDSPWLAPIPHRGKKNHPAWVSHVGQFIADIRGQSVEAFAEATTGNFFRLFKKATR